MAFWIGFALPFGPVLGLARTALVLAESSRLSSRLSESNRRPIHNEWVE